MSPTTHKSFAGDLGLIGLFDLCQLLLLNRATGLLVIENEGRRGYLYFEDGRVVNAVDEEQREGEEAAYRLFTWKAGRFEFRPEPPGAACLIQENTEALMLEAARRIDEAGEAGKPAGSETARLLDRQNAMEALREVFHLVAREARDADGAAAEPTNLLLEALRDADDRLLCRRGRRPRLLHDGSWLVASDVPLDGVAYDELKARLFGGHELTSLEVGAVRSRIVTLEGGRRVAVTLLKDGSAESLWIRPAALRPLDSGLLDGPWDHLRELLDMPNGLVIASGPIFEAVELLLHALVAQLARSRGGTLLLVADEDPYAHEDGAGVVLRVSHHEAESVLRVVRPSVVVFDALRPPTDAVIEAIRIVPLVLVGVVSTEPETAVRRWLAGFEHGDKTQLEALLAAGAVGVVFTPGSAFGEDRLPFITRAMASEPARVDPLRTRK